jgi:hypothetical protein
MLLVMVTRNRVRVSTYFFFPLGVLRVTVICLTLVTLKPKTSRLLEISSLAHLGEGDGLLPC